MASTLLLVTYIYFTLRYIQAVLAMLLLKTPSSIGRGGHTELMSLCRGHDGETLPRATALRVWQNLSADARLPFMKKAQEEAAARAKARLPEPVEELYVEEAVLADAEPMEIRAGQREPEARITEPATSRGSLDQVQMSICRTQL